MSTDALADSSQAQSALQDAEPLKHYLNLRHALAVVFAVELILVLTTVEVAANFLPDRDLYHLFWESGR